MWSGRATLSSRFWRDVAAIGGDGKQLAVGGDDGALGGRGEIKAVGLVSEGEGLEIVLLVVRGEIQFEFRSLSTGGIQFPDSKVVFIDDDFSIARNRRPEKRAVLVMGFKKSGATALVTTEKDARNLFASIPEEIPVVACVIESSICEEQAFEEWLLARLPAGGRAV